MTKITKTFHSPESVAAAVKELQNNDFTDVSVTSSDASGAGVTPGEALITVEAPFGSAAKIIAILDRHGINSRPAAVAQKVQASSECGRSCTASSVLGIPELMRSGPIFSGLPLLIDNPTPLSSALGLPILLRAKLR